MFKAKRGYGKSMMNVGADCAVVNTSQEHSSVSLLWGLAAGKSKGYLDLCFVCRLSAAFTNQ